MASGTWRIVRREPRRECVSAPTYIDGSTLRVHNAFGKPARRAKIAERSGLSIAAVLKVLGLIGEIETRQWNSGFQLRSARGEPELRAGDDL